VNGSVSEHVVDFDLESPEGVVVDWVAHNLYWVDSGTQRVEMSHIDGSSRRVIVWRNVQPRSLAVDPAHGLVMAAVWNRADHDIFGLWFRLSFFFFPRLISAVADWMSAILPHMVWP